MKMFKRLHRLLFLIALVCSISCAQQQMRQSSHTGSISVEALFDLKPKWEDKKDGFEFSGKVNWKPDFKIKFYVGTWCHDSKREIPRLLKILESSNISDEQIEIILLSRNKKEPSEDVLKDRIYYTPTIIVYKNNKEIDRFVEHPHNTWVEDLNRTLNK